MAEHQGRSNRSISFSEPRPYGPKGKLEAAIALQSIISNAGDDELELDQLIKIVINDATRLLGAERSTLFLIDRTHNELWSKVAEGWNLQEIRQSRDVGVAGFVATTGETLRLPDAYHDPRFNPEPDRLSGYRTTSVLCMPVRDTSGAIMGVLQVLNKRVGLFTEEDASKLSVLCSRVAVLVRALALESIGKV